MSLPSCVRSVHQNQMTASEALLAVLEEARLHTRTQLRDLKRTIGFNLAALQFLRRELEVDGIRFFDDAEGILAQAGKPKKRKVGAAKALTGGAATS